MKKLVLLFTGLLMSLTTVSASEFHHGEKKKHVKIVNHYRNVQPIKFIERGITFLVFPDGSFDFNTNQHNTYDKYYYRNSRRGGVNSTFGAPDNLYRYNACGNQGISIIHDRDGKVRRIGNVYLNYDRYGKIKRAGQVYMNYNRGNGRLTQVGGLRVVYNRWGEILNLYGQVNHYNDYCNVCGTTSCNIDHNFKKQHRNRHYDHDDRYDDDDIYYNDDDQYYYYKQNGKKKKHKRNSY